MDSETLLEMARYAFLRLDGAWFMAAAKKFGIEAANYEKIILKTRNQSQQDQYPFQ